MRARVGILAAILAIAPASARAEAVVGAGPVARADDRGRGTGVETTVGIRMATRGEVSGWWHVTGAVARSVEEEAREVRVGPRVWRCAGGVCLGVAADVGLAEGRVGALATDRALVDARALIAVDLDRAARVALVASAGARGTLDLSWEGAGPSQRTRHGTVVGLMLVVRP